MGIVLGICALIFVHCCIVFVVLGIFEYLRQGDGESNRLFGRKVLESCSMERLEEEIRQEKSRENDSDNDDGDDDNSDDDVDGDGGDLISDCSPFMKIESFDLWLLNHDESLTDQFHKESSTELRIAVSDESGLHLMDNYHDDHDGLLMRLSTWIIMVMMTMGMSAEGPLVG